MEVTTHCIVGEAHGFPPYRDYGCSECSNHSMTLWGAEKMPEFREKLQEFVYHWKAEHKDTW